MFYTDTEETAVRRGTCVRPNDTPLITGRASATLPVITEIVVEWKTMSMNAKQGEAAGALSQSGRGVVVFCNLA